MTTAEIAYLLAYDDTNSFYRAFRTWTAQPRTPSGPPLPAPLLPHLNRTIGVHGKWDPAPVASAPSRQSWAAAHASAPRGAEPILCGQPRMRVARIQPLV